MKTPIDAVLAITYLCNSRCKMCSIWQKKPQKELNPEEYLKLPKYLKDINISGGEPFLRNDLIEIIQNVKNACPKARIIVSTNGFLSEIIYRQMKKILEIDPNIGIAVSLDGMEKIHNEIRGIDNGYQKVLKTIENLKSLGIKSIKIAFTASEENTKEMEKVYNFAQEQNLEFTCAAAHNSEHYFGAANQKIQNKKDLKNQFKKIIFQELKTQTPSVRLDTWCLRQLKNFARAYFTRGLCVFALKQKRILPCQAANNFFFLDPQGNIYPCPVSNLIIGNIKEEKFEKIWQSVKAEEIRKKIKNCQRCWMICTARTSIKRNLLKVFIWTVKSKIINFYKK
jgi:MoaA/NifB/PqqE/SkfB family radical SAM enzyme